MPEHAQPSTHGARLPWLGFFWPGAVVLAALITPVPILRAQQVSGPVRGVVRDSAGFTLSHARIQAGDGPEILADGDGRFVLRGSAGQSMLLEVRRLGYQPWRGTVELPSDGSVLEISLLAAPTRLATIQVVAPVREVYDARLAGYEERRRRSVGEFITREQIDRHSSASVIDALRAARGVQITTLGSTMMTRVRLRNASCPPMVYLDGFPASAGEFDFGMIELNTLEGIEIYHGLASIPAGFSAGRGRETCGVIALWSRPTRTPQGRQARRDAEDQARVDAPTDLAVLVAGGNVYTADQVEQPARLQRGVRLPDYPDSLFATRTAGRVVVEFVVNIAGQMVPETYRVVSMSHAAFERAVYEALGEAQFTPAMIGAARVRQVVQLPFEFRPPMEWQF